MQIGALRTADPLYGGSQYESMVTESLAKEHSVITYDARPWVGFCYRPQAFLRNLLIDQRANPDVWIRNEIALTCAAGRLKSRNVALIHHLDDSVGPVGMWNRALHRHLLANARRCDRVVVVSKFWQARLAELGVTQTALIYNAFDVGRFDVGIDDVRAFRELHGLIGKPVIYIGNCQKHKGTSGVWRALQKEDYHLVTSGLSDVELPIRNFLLPYDQYVLLLAASDAVVTMSTFEEGWNRTAHEALLCKTPVVGSGTGGMGELLEGGGQLLCRELADLPEMVRRALNHRPELGTRGYAFASGFTTERFTQQWLDLISAL